MVPSALRFAALICAASFASVEGAGAAGVRLNRQHNGQLWAVAMNKSSSPAIAAKTSPIGIASQQFVKRRPIQTLFSRAVSLLKREPEKESDATISTSTIVAQLTTVGIWVGLTIAAAYLYRKYKIPTVVDLEAAKTQFDGEEFKHGLCSWYEEPVICAFACCCSPIRWADTIASANVLSFLTAFVIYTVLMTLDLITAGVTIWIFLTICFTYFRQRLRWNLGMRSGGTSVFWDLAVWCCCVPCAITQEARQVHEAPTADESPVKGQAV